MSTINQLTQLLETTKEYLSKVAADFFADGDYNVYDTYIKDINRINIITSDITRKFEFTEPSQEDLTNYITEKYTDYTLKLCENVSNSMQP